MKETMLMDVFEKFKQYTDCEITNSSYILDLDKMHYITTIWDTPMFDSLMRQFGDIFKVEVQSSIRHGKGVFATDTIECGDVVTFYPCDAIVVKHNDTGNTLVKYYSKHITESDKELVKCNKKSLLDYSTILTNHNNYQYYAYGHPSNINDNKCIGHMINDAYKYVDKFKTVDCMDFLAIGDIIMDYTLRTNNDVNCRIRENGLISYVVATKKINKGEECVCSYGFPYWMPSVNVLKHDCMWFKIFLDTYLKDKSPSQKEFIRNQIIKSAF